MYRRLSKLLTLWMLPLLVARAIVPVGFMFMADADGLRLMFCPSVSATVEAPQAGAHDGHDMHANMHHDVRHDVRHDHDMRQMQAGSAEHPSDDAPAMEHDKTPCPFSLVAALARVDLTYVAVLAALVSERSDSFKILPDLARYAVQSLPIRGPPALS
jgi:hypothetical protein